MAGEQEAWRKFHSQYDRLIYRCIRRVIQGFSALVRSEDEREVFSNLIVQLLSNDKRKLRSFDPDRGSRLGTWLGLLATNAAYDYLRSVRREVPRVPLSEAETATYEGSSPFEKVERKQRSRMVKRLMARLSNKDQQFVALYLFQSWSFARGRRQRDADQRQDSVFEEAQDPESTRGHRGGASQRSGRLANVWPKRRYGLARPRLARAGEGARVLR